MNIKLCIKITALLVIFYFFSCDINEVDIQKINTQILAINSTNNSTNNYSTEKNVYVTGYIGYYEGGASGALAWRNGICSMLLDNGTGRATCIAFDDTILYLVGVNQYFKNGYVMPLNSGSTGTYTYLNTTDIAISNHDVYISGSDNGKAVYWKNCEENNLSSGTSATGIFVTSNYDVYVSGYGSVTYYHPYYSTDYAYYWKNGSKVSLGEGIANDIAVLDTIVYTVGCSNSTAVYWKNGIKTNLSGLTSIYSSANEIVISGNDIYIAGKYDNGAVYWKNGIMITLNSNDYTSKANSIFVDSDNNDVYLSGNIGDGTFQNAVYWKNGTLNVLPATMSFPYEGERYSSTDIYVK